MRKTKRKSYTYTHKPVNIIEGVYTRRDSQYWSHFLKTELDLLRHAEQKLSLVFHWLPHALSQEEVDALNNAAKALNLLVKGREVFMPTS